jgi:tetratricopeptide (TPR) repeat protein
VPWLLLLVTLAGVPNPDAGAAYERGRRLYELGSDMPGARAALDDAIRLAPDFADAYLYRALVSEDGGGYRASRPDFERAQALAPGMKEIWRHHAEAILNSGDPARAEAYYLMAIALDPRYGEAWYMLGRLYRKTGRTDAAIRAYERDAVLEPKGSAHHELGEVYLFLGDDARAAPEFAADLEIDPTCYESRINIAGLALDHGDAATARRHFEESLNYHPADERALSGLGRAYLALGDDERAVGALRAAQDLSPDDARVRDALDQARLRLRLRYGWPFAVLPSAIVLGLVAYLVRMRKRST